MSDYMFSIGFTTDESGLRKLESEIEKVTKKAKAVEAQIASSKGIDAKALTERYEKLLQNLNLLSRAHQELSLGMVSAAAKGEVLKASQVNLSASVMKNISVLGTLRTRTREVSDEFSSNARVVASVDALTDRLEGTLRDVTSALNSQTEAINKQNEAQEKNLLLTKQRIEAAQRSKEVRQASNSDLLNTADAVESGSLMLERSFAVAKQALLTAPIYGAAYALTGAISQAVSDYVQLDTILNRIAIVTDQTTENVRNLTKEFSHLGMELSVTGKEYAKGALMFYQQGGDAIKYAKDLTKATIQLSNATGQSADETAEYITAIGNSFKLIEKGPESIQKIGDVLLYLDKASAASADEIGDAMRRAASVFEAAGFDIETSSAMIATALQVTRQAPERVGTAFKTLIETMQEVKAQGPDAVREFTNKIQDEIDKFPNLKNKLKLFEDNGEMVGAKDFLKQLQSAYNDLKEIDPKGVIAVVQAIGGKENANILISLLENQKLFLELLEGSQSSAGEAAKSQLEYQKSIKANIDEFKNAWEEFVNSLLKSDFIIAILDALTSLFATMASVLERTSGFLNAIIVAVGSGALVMTITRTFAVLRAATTASDITYSKLFLTLLGLQDISEKGIDPNLDKYNKDVEIAKIKMEQLELAAKKAEIQINKTFAGESGKAYSEDLKDIERQKNKVRAMSTAGAPYSEIQSAVLLYSDKEAEIKEQKRVFDLQQEELNRQEKEIDKQIEKNKRKMAVATGPRGALSKALKWQISDFGDSFSNFVEQLFGKLIKRIPMALSVGLGGALVSGIVLSIEAALNSGEKGFIAAFVDAIKENAMPLIGGGIGSIIGTAVFPGIGTIIGGLIGSGLLGALSDFLSNTKTKEQIAKETEELVTNIDAFKKLELKRRAGIQLTLEELKAYYALIPIMDKYSVSVNNVIAAEEELLQKKQLLNIAQKNFMSAIQAEKGQEVALRELTKATDEYNISKQKQILIEELNKKSVEIGTEQYNKLYKEIVSGTTNTFSQIKKIVDSNPDVFKAIKDDIKDLSITTNTNLKGMHTAATTYLANMENMSKTEQLAAVKNMIRSFGITDDIVDMSATNAASLMQIMATTATATQQFVSLQDTITKMQAETASGKDEISKDLKEKYFNQRKALAQTLGITEDQVSVFAAGGYPFEKLSQAEKNAYYQQKKNIQIELKKIDDELDAAFYGKKDLTEIERRSLLNRKQSYEKIYQNLENFAIQDYVGENVTQVTKDIIKKSLLPQIEEMSEIGNKTFIGPPIPTPDPSKTTEGSKSFSEMNAEDYRKRFGIRLKEEIEVLDIQIKGIENANIVVSKKIADLKTNYKIRGGKLKELEDLLKIELSKTMESSMLSGLKKSKTLIVDKGTGLFTEESIQNALLEVVGAEKKAVSAYNAAVKAAASEKSDLGKETSAAEEKKLEGLKTTADNAKKRTSAIKDLLETNYKALKDDYVDTKNKILKLKDEEQKTLEDLEDLRLNPPKRTDISEKTREQFAVGEDQIIKFLDQEISSLEQQEDSLKEKSTRLVELYQRRLEYIIKGRGKYKVEFEKSISALTKTYGLDMEGAEISANSIAIKRSQLEANLIDAQNRLNTPEPGTLEKDLKPLRDNLVKAEDDLKSFNKQIDYYNELQQEFSKRTDEARSAIEEIKKSITDIKLDLLEQNITEILFGTTAIDQLENYFDKLLGYQDQYLNKLEKAISFADMEREIEKDKLKYGTNPQITAFQSRISKMKKDDTEYSERELEVMSAEYDVTLKQILLKRMEQSKDGVRLMRDAEGNWVYGTTESKTKEDATIAADELADSAKKLYEVSKNALRSTANETIAIGRSIVENQRDQAEQNIILEDSKKTAEQKKAASENLEYLQKIEKVLTQEASSKNLELGRQFENFKRAATIAGASAIKDPVLTGFVEKILTSTETNIDKVFGGKVPDSILGLIEPSMKETSMMFATIGETLSGFKENLQLASTSMSNISSAINETAAALVATVSAEIAKINKSYIPPIIPSPKIASAPELAKTTPEQNEAFLKGAGPVSSKGAEAFLGKPPEGAFSPVFVPAETKKSFASMSASEKLAFIKDQSKESMEAAANEIDRATDVYNREKAKKTSEGNKAAAAASAWASKIREAMGYDYYKGGGRPWSYDTGGYTGNFEGGRLAVLHSKELVLNKEDTKNILDSVKINRDMSALFNNLSSQDALKSVVNKNDNSSSSTIINASFPNVSSADEIRKAFANMSNSAAQFAYRMRPQY